MQPGADAVQQTSQDGWTCGTPLAALTDGRNAMLAVAMNGQPLPIEHGFPVRMIVPGLYGYVSATKWVVDLEVTRFADFTAYWTERGWSPKGPVKTESRVDVPRDGADVQAGAVPCRRLRLGAAHRHREGGVPPRRRRLADGRARRGCPTTTPGCSGPAPCEVAAGRPHARGARHRPVRLHPDRGPARRGARRRDRLGRRRLHRLLTSRFRHDIGTTDGAGRPRRGYRSGFGTYRIG